MGDDKLDSMLYAIDRETGEKFAIGKTTSRLTDVEIENNSIANLGETLEAEMIINLKTITKKRFIKLLMSKSYQRNEAIKIHKEYMKKYKVRSRIGLEFFIVTREEDN